MIYEGYTVLNFRRRINYDYHIVCFTDPNLTLNYVM